MKANRPSFFSRFRRSDKIILGVIAVMVAVTMILNLLARLGLPLVNESLMLYLPVATLVALVAWGGYALIRRIKSRGIRIVVVMCAVMALLLVITVGFAYLNLVTYTAMPHAYKTLADPNGGHRLVVMWRFDDDPERNAASVEQRKAARLELYPDSNPETIADDVTVAFTAYPRGPLGLFYRSNANVEGEVFLAYTGNIAGMDVIEPAATAEPEASAQPEATAEATAEPEATAAAEEAVGADTASDEAVGAGAATQAEPAVEPEVIRTPHGTMMLEWLEDNTVAHFYVKDPGTAEGGECFVRF